MLHVSVCVFMWLVCIKENTHTKCVYSLYIVPTYKIETIVCVCLRKEYTRCEERVSELVLINGNKAKVHRVKSLGTDWPWILSCMHTILWYSRLLLLFISIACKLHCVVWLSQKPKIGVSAVLDLLSCVEGDKNILKIVLGVAQW